MKSIIDAFGCDEVKPATPIIKEPVMSKGIYTQEMCDAGVLPSVGMSCRVCISGCERGEAGHIEFINDIGWLFRYDDNNLCDFYLSDDVILFKPLTTITLINGERYEFDYGEHQETVMGLYDEHANDFNVAGTMYNTKLAINIKHLTVK